VSFLINPHGFGVGEIVNTGDVVGGEINLSGLDLSPYYTIRLFLSGLKVNADDNAIGLQLAIAGSLVTSGYQYAYGFRDSADLSNFSGSTSAAHINLHSEAANDGVGTATGESLSGYLDITNAVSSLNKHVSGHMSHRQADGHSAYTTISGMLTDTGNVTGFRLFCTDGGGSLIAGRVFLMGLA
jgi:hypothetical protein